MLFLAIIQFIQSLPRFDAFAGDAEDARATHCATGLQTVILDGIVSRHLVVVIWGFKLTAVDFFIGQKGHKLI